MASQRQSLWIEARKLLSQEEVQAIDFDGSSDKIVVLEDLQKLTKHARDECLQKRWSCFKRSTGETVILRDLFSKLIVWVDRFIEVGDVTVAFDPAHTALPWAGVRFLLKVATSDIKQFDFLVNGAERIAHAISYYAIFENLYLSRAGKVAPKLEDVLTRLYANILTYLARAKHYFEQRTAKRIAKSAFLSRDKFDEISRLIEEYKAQADNYATLIDAETEINISSSVGNLASDTSDHMKKLESMLQSMDSPIKRLDDHMTVLEDHLREEERKQVLAWLSTQPYPEHHAQNRKGVLENTGRWLLTDDSYKLWKTDSASSLLWVHGTSGTGKTKLASIVIDDAFKDYKDGLSTRPAYFYCSSNSAEPDRSTPACVVASITRQLSALQSGGPVLRPTMDLYEEKKREGLDISTPSIDECEALVLALVEQRPVTNIIIDALDECSPETRFELLDFIESLLENSQGLLKVLVTSRDDSDIRIQFLRYPNLKVSSDKNSGDIEAFVRAETERLVQKRRLLHTSKSKDELKELIIKTLIDQANGMFRWVAMQLEALCLIKLDADIRDRLGRLPVKLAAIYLDTYDRVSARASHFESQVINNTFSWLLCAKDLIKTSDFLYVVSIEVEDDGDTISVEQLVDLCCNFVVWDEGLDAFRFAHQSVEEFLVTEDSFSEAKVNSFAAQMCLWTLLSLSETPGSGKFLPKPQKTIKRVHWRAFRELSRFQLYALEFWPEHAVQSEEERLESPLQELLQTCLFEDAAPNCPLSVWLRHRRRRAGDVERNFVQLMELYTSTHIRAFLVACIYGFLEIMDICMAQEDLPADVIQNCTIAATLGSRSEVLMKLLEGRNGITVNSEALVSVGIYWDGHKDHEKTFRLLLQHYPKIHLSEDVMHLLLGETELNIFQIFLDWCPREFLTPDIMQSSIEKMGPDCFEYLLDTVQLEISGDVIAAAGRNLHNPKRTLQAVLQRGKTLDQNAVESTLTEFDAPEGMVEFLEQSGAEIVLKKQLLEKVAQNGSPIVMRELVQRDTTLEFDDSILLLGCRNFLHGEKMVETILSRSKNVPVSTDMLLAAANNGGSGAGILVQLFASEPKPMLTEEVMTSGMEEACKDPKMAHVLLDNGGMDLLTDNVLMAATTRSTFESATGMSVIMDRCTKDQVNISEQVLCAALKGLLCDETIVILLERYEGAMVTAGMFAAALSNLDCSDEMLSLLFQRPMDESICLSDDIVRNIVSSSSKTARDALLLLESHFGTIKMTRNLWHLLVSKGTPPVLIELMDREHGQPRVSETLLISAASHEGGPLERDAIEIFRTLLQRSNGFKITEAILVAAIESRQWFLKDLIILFCQQGFSCTMTEGITFALMQSSPREGSSVLRILEQHCGPLKITGKCLVAAALYNYYDILEVLLDQCSGTLPSARVLFAVASTGNLRATRILLRGREHTNESEMWISLAHRCRLERSMSSEVGYDEDEDHYFAWLPAEEVSWSRSGVEDDDNSSEPGERPTAPTLTERDRRYSEPQGGLQHEVGSPFYLASKSRLSVLESTRTHT